MAKHPLDRTRPASTRRAQVYTDPSRSEGPHPATRALIQRPRGESTKRAQVYTRIERETA